MDPGFRSDGVLTAVIPLSEGTRPKAEQWLAFWDDFEQRVARMWQQGFVAEVARLADRGLRESRTASRALGYRPVLDFLAGRITEEEARAATGRATRRFARRQDSWFRRDPRISWLCYDRPDLVQTAARLLEGSSAPR